MDEKEIEKILTEAFIKEFGEPKQNIMKQQLEYFIEESLSFLENEKIKKEFEKYYPYIDEENRTATGISNLLFNIENDLEESE